MKFSFFALCFSVLCFAHFESIPLGTAGGLDESNLTSFLLKPKGEEGYVALDAGTIWNGLKVAQKKGAFKKYRGKDVTWLQQNLIQSYLISHSHLDHFSGLILSSPGDSKKTVMSSKKTLDDIKKFVMNGTIWANFTTEGERAIGRYTFLPLKSSFQKIPGTSLEVKPFRLSHAKMETLAFLIKHKERYTLYFGDTGPDAVEKQGRLKKIWKEVAPLVRDRKMRSLFIEVSFPDPRKESLLFSHLTPKWLTQELGILANEVNPRNAKAALKGFQVVVTHIKPATIRGESARQLIKKQLQKLNRFGVRYLYPEQGRSLSGL